MALRGATHVNMGGFMPVYTDERKLTAKLLLFKPAITSHF